MVAFSSLLPSLSSWIQPSPKPAPNISKIGDQKMIIETKIAAVQKKASTLKTKLDVMKNACSKQKASVTRAEKQKKNHEKKLRNLPSGRTRPAKAAKIQLKLVEIEDMIAVRERNFEKTTKEVEHLRSCHKQAVDRREALEEKLNQLTLSQTPNDLREELSHEKNKTRRQQKTIESLNQTVFNLQGTISLLNDHLLNLFGTVQRLLSSTPISRDIP